MATTEFSRRQLLKAAALAAAGAAPAAGALPAAAATPRWQNWSGSQSANPRWQLHPESLAELREALAVAPTGRIGVGAGHSFSPLCPTAGTLVDIGALRGLVSYNEERLRARVRAGTPIRDLGPMFNEIGQALPNQGDVDPQTVAGACGTSTHGTGRTLGSFSSLVTAAQLLTPQGDMLEISENENAEWLPAVACNLGVLGLLTEIELQNREPYRLEEVLGTAPLRETLANFAALSRDARHFEVFIFPYSDTLLTKTLRETTERPTPEPEFSVPDSEIFAALTRLGHGVAPLDGPLQKALTALYPSSRRVGDSWRIFPSDREQTRFNEMEYELPFARGIECLAELLTAIRKADLNLMFPLEVRSVAADTAWISPFYRQDSLSISVHQWVGADHRPLFALAEPILRRHGGRPHWGKMHTLRAADFAALYPRWEDFSRLRRELDPAGRMLSPPLREMLV